MPNALNPSQAKMPQVRHYYPKPGLICYGADHLQGVRGLPLRSPNPTPRQEPEAPRCAHHPAVRVAAPRVEEPSRSADRANGRRSAELVRPAPPRPDAAALRGAGTEGVGAGVVYRADKTPLAAPA
jgi:hypothetical protein